MAAPFGKTLASGNEELAILSEYEYIRLRETEFVRGSHATARTGDSDGADFAGPSLCASLKDPADIQTFSWPLCRKKTTSV
jgi:hypothetical protein